MQPEIGIAARQPRALFAVSPEGVGREQAELRSWLAVKIHRLHQDQEEAEECAEIAGKAKQKAGPFRRLAKKLGKQAIYYEKIGAAIDADYLILPNFSLDLFAVRVQHERPVAGARYEGVGQIMDRDQGGGALPQGEGRYVAPEPFIEHVRDGETPTGHTYEIWAASEYDAVAFPVIAVKPAVMAATAKAQAHKLFDEIGLCMDSGSGCGDPIVAGRIIDKTRVGRGNVSFRSVTFFVAWWLDPESL